MSCKHEGGGDPCVLYPNDSHCAVQKRLYDRANKIQRRRLYYQAREKKGYRYKKSVARNSQYSRENIIRARLRATPPDAGQAGEHLVAADLLRRGLTVTKPLNTNGLDDLHVKCGMEWVTVQVKLAGVNRKTGTIQAQNVSKITSDIAAYVDLISLRIRYVPAGREQVPAVLENNEISNVAYPPQPELQRPRK